MTKAEAAVIEAAVKHLEPHEIKEEEDAVQVKRYVPEHWDEKMVENPSGRYVLYTDAVKAQREAFVEGAWYGREVSGAEAEATRRYKEE